MRFNLTWSFGILAAVAVACGGDEFTPGASGDAGAGASGGGPSGGKAGTGSGGSTAGSTTGGTSAGTSSAGASGAGSSAGSTTGGSAGTTTAKACDTGADCGKADPCKGVPFCSNHTCFLDTSAVPNIEDNNLCTKDACNPLTGMPTHTAIAVGDGNPCTKDSCDPAKGPQHTLDPACTGCQKNDDCDDGDPCTDDTCSDTKCSNKAKPAGGECGAGDACTGKSFCDIAGVCKPTAPKIVDDGNECTVDACNPNDGKVTHEPRSADDKNPCTVDACDPQNGVTHTPIPVDDGDACTRDTCEPSGAITHIAIDPSDGEVCTVDTCEKATGPKHEKIPNCDGSCKADKDCSDKNPCTKDSCKGGVCSFVNDDTLACNDGLFCTSEDKCSAGVCAGKPVAVDDGKACTKDSCDEAAKTILHIDVPVDDGNVCTQDSCDPATGLVGHSQISGCCTSDSQCDGAFPSSSQEVCRKAGGKCQPDRSCLKHTETKIADDYACTKDICYPETGEVAHPPLGKANGCCTVNEDCPGGAREGTCFAPGTCHPSTFVCVYGQGVPIDDQKSCTTDSCNANTGEVFHPEDPAAPCCQTSFQCPPPIDSDETCTPPMSCVEGSCVSGGEPVKKPMQNEPCREWKCAPDGGWTSCCALGSGVCSECMDPMGTVCSGIKG